ncbi:Tubulin-tyrosine ligase family protein [Tritrichomonas foetus]|uniref:Tubulin-tyrosine ligase family protein n=1 Tax=Tritrichomonas foetus TaxID=1144522 RepID=A0A1J4KQS9_9EUKA|nr:Tubulin-tyrosine ligase family protein [Tritrichomonas foetus]|eukprot:OHT13641.1 Tubulin-tyrosine ligase family protein [Tritrichomonas foetus]
MAGVIATGGYIKYETVSEAMKAANIQYQDDPHGMLVWFDNVKDKDFFTNLLPYQIVNRIPSINMLCRKAPFVRLIQRVAPMFPEFFTFLPASFILPINNQQFTAAVNRKKTRYIVKPDGGSLGKGIMIVEPGDVYTPQVNLAIAQEYIESKLIRNTKFDMRIYVLVASVQPLMIYVYRDGIARFCSQPEDAHNVFSQLTNTAVNRQNPQANIQNITQRVSAVFEELAAEGANVDEIWKKIDRIAVFTIISASNYILKAVHASCPTYGLPRCFQILGFDILLDQKLDPYILEVNFRPSLEFDTEDEKNLKIEMLSHAMQIAAPFQYLQSVISTRKSPWNDKMWASYLQHNPNQIKESKRLRKKIVRESKFVRVFPLKTAENENYMRVFNSVKSLPVKMAMNYGLPDQMEMPRQKVGYHLMKPLIAKPLKQRSKSPSRKKMPLLPLST